MNSQQLALKKDMDSVETRMAQLLPKLEFEKLKKKVETLAEKDKVEQIAEELKSLDRGMGIYASTKYVDEQAFDLRQEYTLLIEPKLQKSVFEFKIKEIEKNIVTHDTKHSENFNT